VPACVGTPAILAPETGICLLGVRRAVGTGPSVSGMLSFALSGISEDAKSLIQNLCMYEFMPLQVPPFEHFSNWFQAESLREIPSRNSTGSVYYFS
jgi:hypothetical protein